MTIDRTARVGVLMGGMSSEREISLASGHAVAGALAERGWNAVAIDVGRDLAAQLRAEAVDVAWLALHGRYGEDGCVQGALEVLGIPYTGSGVLASAMAMDKLVTKRWLRDSDDVVLAKQWMFERGCTWPDDLSFPLVIKPAVGGSTLGMVKVDGPDGLAPALQSAFAEYPAVFAEAFVVGEEITVAVLDGEALPIVRILPVDGFFDFEAKYTKGRTVYEVPADIAAATAEQARRASVEAYRALGCRGLARADFIVRSDGVPVFLEINTLPGMTPTSLSPMAAGANGISFAELVERILVSARLDGAVAT